MPHRHTPRVPPLSSAQPGSSRHDHAAAITSQASADAVDHITASAAPDTSTPIKVSTSCDAPARPAWAVPAQIALDRLVPERRAHLGRGLAQMLGALALHREAMEAETVLPPADHRLETEIDESSDPIDDPAILDWQAMKAQEEPARTGPPVPLAVTLSSQKVLEMIEGGEDPFAVDSATGLTRPPYAVDARQVLVLARLCASFGDQAGVDAALGDGGAVAILCADEPEMAALAEVIRMAVRATPVKVGDRRPLPPLRPQIVSLLASSRSTRESSHEAAVKALCTPRPLVVLAMDPAHLTGVLAQLPALTLAPVDAEVVLFTLREVATGTGQLDETAVRAVLPDDRSLAHMAMDSLLLALRSPGPIKAACRLAELAQMPVVVRSAPSGPDLDALPGLGPARARLTRIAADLRAFVTGELPWEDVSNGLILEGPPGTGKTTIAACLARSAQMSFVPVTCTDWFRAGRFEVMLQAMHETFEAAHRAAPCLLFIDEIDSLRDRSGKQDRNSSWNAAVVNAVLPLLDGAAGHRGVYIVGATNHPEHLDAAILRAGRLGQRIHIAPPRERELPDVFRHHLGADLAGVDLASVARRGAGMTPADVKASVQEARSLARAARRSLQLADLAAAVGTTHPAVPAALRRRVAVHEAGHVVAAHVAGHARPVAATLSGAVGHAEMELVPHAGDRTAVTATLVRHLAGRAAEDVLLGNVSDDAGGSAASDLAQATRAALQEALSLGRGNDLAWHPATEDPAVLYGRHRGLRDRITRRLDGAYARACSIIRADRTAVEAIAAHLVVDGHLDEADLRDLLVYCTERPAEDGPEENGVWAWR